MKLNCIVIEDDLIQRMINVKLVNKHPDLQLLANFSNANEAKKFLASQAVDLIFLDIEMPVITGFDFLDGLKVKPQIIFLTSKSEYALKAFSYQATDFIQKPISVNRFDASVKRAVDFHKLKHEEESEHIFVKSNLKKLKVNVNKIKWIEAFGDYVKVITEKDKNLVLSTLKSFEEELPKEKFLRVHKSFIINIDKVNRFNSKFAEIGTVKIPLSRNKKEDLIKALAIA
jgi:two-component system LytT family response regulator